ncbi:MAG: hypothetical protein KAS66_05190 [Candidatus Omnitrophica bacterium]|nr:hypothetical protein [Candidatus Omnitrophota bacterium]
MTSEWAKDAHNHIDKKLETLLCVLRGRSRPIDHDIADTIETQAKQIVMLEGELEGNKIFVEHHREQIEELIGALEPFANYGEALGGQLISDMRVMAELWDNKIIVKDLKQAHTILAKHNKRDG